MCTPMRKAYFSCPSCPKRGHTLVTKRPKKVDIWDILVDDLDLKTDRNSRNV